MLCPQICRGCFFLMHRLMIANLRAGPASCEEEMMMANRTFGDSFG